MALVFKAKIYLVEKRTLSESTVNENKVMT